MTDPKRELVPGYRYRNVDNDAWGYVFFEDDDCNVDETYNGTFIKDTSLDKDCYSWTRFGEYTSGQSAPANDLNLSTAELFNPSLVPQPDWAAVQRWAYLNEVNQRLQNAPIALTSGVAASMNHSGKSLGSGYAHWFGHYSTPSMPTKIPGTFTGWDVCEPAAPSEPKCDCGAAIARTSHSHWCSLKK